MSTRYSFSVKYKGNNHCGWQYGRTKKLRGVSNNLNKSLRRSTNGLPLLVAGSGRTDSGVHGLRQAAQVDLVRQKKNFVFDINDLSADDTWSCNKLSIDIDIE